jgi:rubredoxin
MADKKCTCQACGYEYDPSQGQPAKGVPEGTSFDALPEDWICPDCGAGKDLFDAAE